MFTYVVEGPSILFEACIESGKLVELELRVSGSGHRSRRSPVTCRIDDSHGPYDEARCYAPETADWTSGQ
jgi:hypothetical protein